MDPITRSHYEVCFERDFLKLKGEAFQDYFATVMEKRYPGDFIRTRPWGNTGDRKNDGYVKSLRTLFQVYAPNELSAADAIKKIDEDFNEAIPHWKQHFSIWRFVHNSRSGLGPDVTKKLLDLDANHTDITVSHFGFEEFRQELFSLALADIASVLGPPISSGSFASIGFDALQPILLAVGQASPSSSADIRPVPANKLSANSLSSNVEALLKVGMTKSDTVGGFFKKWHDPSLGDKVAKAFTEKYQALKASGISPDQIFVELQTFAGGGKRGTPEHEAAVLAVLAYFFEECDIFERPSEDSK